MNYVKVIIAVLTIAVIFAIGSRPAFDEQEATTDSTAATATTEAATPSTAAQQQAYTPVTPQSSTLVSGPGEGATQAATTEGSQPPSFPEPPPVEHHTEIEITPSPETPAAPQQIPEPVERGISVDVEGSEGSEDEQISLDLKGIEINELLRVLALKTGTTIVPTRNVTGRVNIFLNNLSFKDALDVVLISQDLACERKGNIINVMTAAEYEKLFGKKYNEKRKFQTRKLTYAKPSLVFNTLSQVKSDIGKVVIDEASATVLMVDVPEKLVLMNKTINDLDQPLETEIFDIKYAKPADMKTQLTSAITPGSGELFVDERSSKVVVMDLPEKMRKIKRIINAFDEESRQVFIEVDILQITLTKEYERGIEWDKVFGEEEWLKWLKISGLTLAGDYASSLSTVATTINVGQMSKEKYTAVIKLLSTYGNTKIISRPRLAVVNNQEAKILVGTREAYVTQSQSQASDTTVTAENVEFIDVGVKLNVTPTINSEGFVTMKIKPEVSTVSSYLTTPLKSKVPIVDTSESETVVKVKDGTMIMISGLMKEEKRDDISGFPGLAKIPVLGMIFGNRAAENTKTELVVFMTPYIISGKMTPGYMERDKYLPPDMAVERDEEDIISSKLDNIKVGGLFKGELVIEGQPEPVFIKDKSPGEGLGKMKGLKEF